MATESFFFCLRLRDYCSNSCFKTSRCFALPAASAGVLRSPLQYAPGAMLMISALFALLHAALRQPFTSSRALHAAIHEHLRAVNTIDGLHHPSLAWINLDPLNCFIGTHIYIYICLIEPIVHAILAALTPPFMSSSSPRNRWPASPLFSMD